jgi:hypothetical protein
MKQTRRIGSDLLIYFDEAGIAGFTSNSRKELAAVKLELSEWQDFVERWLQSVEEPEAIRLSPEEERLRTLVEKAIKSLRKLGATRDSIINSNIVSLIREHWTNLSPERIEAIVRDVASTL